MRLLPAVRSLLTHPEPAPEQTFPRFRCTEEASCSRVERALSPFADVRPGEGATALLLAATVFLLLGGYYVLKTAREALILTEGGAEVKAYSSAAQAMLLLGVVPAYGWLASHVSRMRLIGLTNLAFGATLLMFAASQAIGLRVGVPFFIWLGIYNVFVISQFWAFANDLYTEGQGRRLFPIIGVGSSLGAWIGAEAAGLLVASVAAQPAVLMLLATTLLAVCQAMILGVHHRERRRSAGDLHAASEAPIGGAGGFRLVVTDRYLLLVAVLMVVLNIVNTSGEFLLGKLVTAEAALRFPSAGDLPQRQQFIGAFYGAFFGRVNLLGLVLQLFVTSRVLQHVGVRGALFILPAIALLNYSVIAVAPMLAVVAVLKVLENSVDYSVQNTVRQALFLPTPREAKYKAKAAIDTFFVRVGDVLQAVIVRVGTGLGASIGTFALTNLVLTLAWLGVAAGLAREHRKRTI